jgi:TetR/AcrR family transcriptional regulator, ethionamide resistance regulator
MSKMASATQSRLDRRRRHEQVKAAVREATLELVGDAPFKDVTVDEIAQGAGLTRSAFYFYFRDKHDVLMSATEDVVELVYREADRWWHGDDSDSRLLIRAALEGVVSVYEQNATLLRVATEVSSYDDEVRDLWKGLVERFIEATEQHLRREQGQGRVSPALDARTMAEALVWMTERCCYIYLGRRERPAEEVAEALIQTWTTALYPRG